MDGRNGDVPEPAPANAPPDANPDADESKAFGQWAPPPSFSDWADRARRHPRTVLTVALLASLLLLLGASGLGYYWARAHQAAQGQAELRHAAQKFQEPLYWPPNQVRTLDATFHLATKWLPKQPLDGQASISAGMARYKFRIEGYPSPLQNAWRSDVSASYYVTVRLLDKDDFRITTIKIPFTKMVRTLNPRGEGIGFTAQGSISMPLRTYRRIDDWKVNWNL